jgi:hypothetical protein
MKNKKRTFLSLLCIGMEIFWMYAWASFSMTAAKGLFPLVGAFIMFGVAAVITHFSTGRGWRIIYLAVLYLLASGASLLIIFYLAYFSSLPLFSNGWIILFFSTARSPLELLNLILLIVWSVLFWISGRFFSRRENTYYTVCGRFDLGLAAFFSLFFLKLILEVKGGIKVDDMSFTLIFPFILFSLLAIGIANTKSTSKNFLPGFRWIGIILGIGIVIILSALIILVLTPVLTRTAETGYSLFKSGAHFIMPGVVSVLRFLFGPRSMRSEPAASSPKSDNFNWDSDGGWWSELLDKIFKWGIKIFAIMLVAVISGIALYYLFKWLFSKTAFVRREIRKSYDGAPWYRRLLALLLSILKMIMIKLRGYSKASEFYRLLLRWGRRSGIPGLINETPLEYADRLKDHFPRLKTDIELIVSSFNREVYGGLALPGELISDTRSSWRRLRSPFNWPARLKRLLFMGSISTDGQQS